MTKRPKLEELEDLIVQVINEGQGLTRWEREFMESLREQWEQQRYISIKQEDTLVGIHKQRVK